MLKRSLLFFSNFLERPLSFEEVVAGNFKVIKHLGMGSYGHSYLVMDLSKQQVKVLKALRIHKRITKSGRRGFELEKKILKSINHPGFPQYFEEGIFKEIPFYTMEYIDGKNFEQLIFSEGWTISEQGAFQIADELLILMEYLHSRNIIHRDIRIPNVIFDGSKVRLIDLGLGRYLGQEIKGKILTNGLHLRKGYNFQADFYGLGHFLLFLLYSNYSFNQNQKEKSWEEELNISSKAKHIIRKLLQIEPAYDHCCQIREDIKELST
ncbi:serine/threonine-protein kinase [Neobacillus cucumis]|uniref:Serine/threonine protein kinase n=1 Tax=Neobacillus cucumis TaxID=1740721 RepID=A0A2N5H7V5_9BACI|nr:protein kinase [Neobacillus cucumis]PLS01593.1 serine/threonine protein kinase [Neobacillus cucumis]